MSATTLRLGLPQFALPLHRVCVHAVNPSELGYFSNALGRVPARNFGLSLFEREIVGVSILSYPAMDLLEYQR